MSHLQWEKANLRVVVFYFVIFSSFLQSFISINITEIRISLIFISVTPFYLLFHLQKYSAMYKIDWKVCFMIWALKMDKMALYHAYIEDDSFLCTENLLHQVTILKNIPEGQRGLPIRTGMQVKK